MRLATDEVIDLILEQSLSLEPACGSTQVLAIDGPSGAGKTALATRLATRAAPVGTRVLHLEDLYPGWYGLEAAVPLTKNVLAAISAGNVGSAQQWDWHADRPGDELRVPPTDLLIVEGVTAGACELAAFTNVLVWIDGPAELRKARAMSRDGEAYAPWWDIWAEQERLHFEREQTASRADIHLNTHT